LKCTIAANSSRHRAALAAALNNNPREDRQVRLSATATNEASATTAVVTTMLAVILSPRHILEWSTAAHVVDTDVKAARNPRIVSSPPNASLKFLAPIARQSTIPTPIGII